MYYPGLRNRGFYDGMIAPVDLIYDGTLIPNIASQSHHWNRINQMFDRLNPVGVNGYRAVGPCHALDIKASPIQGWSGTNSNNDGSITQQFSWKLDPRPSTTAEVEAYFDSVCVIPGGELMSARLSAWNKFYTQVPDIVSVANFLLELKDFAKYYELLKNIPSYLRAASANRAVKGLGKRAKRGIGSRVKGGLAKANDSFLEYEFAWAPFVGDLAKFLTLVQTVSNKLQWLKETRGKPTPVKYFQPDFVKLQNPSDYATVLEIGPDGNGTHELRQLKLLKSKATFASHAMLYQELNGLDDAWAEFRAIIAALGLGSPATIVWNAIPFSFMLDWIFPVGKWLQRFAVQPFYGTWDIYDVSNSVKVEATIEESVYRRAWWGGPYVRTTLRTHSVNSYNRDLGLDLSLDDVGFTSLNDHQQQLFASLVAGNTLFKSKHR